MCNFLTQAEQHEIVDLYFTAKLEVLQIMPQNDYEMSLLLERWKAEKGLIDSHFGMNAE